MNKDTRACSVAMGRADAFIEFGCSFEGKVSRAFILQKIGGNVQNYVDTGYNYWETGLIAVNGRLSITQ